jgi:hypothetical protein
MYSGHAAPHPGGAQKTARGHMEEKQSIRQTHSEESNPGDMPRNTMIHTGTGIYLSSVPDPNPYILLNLDPIHVRIRVQTKIF